MLSLVERRDGIIKQANASNFGNQTKDRIKEKKVGLSHRDCPKKIIIRKPLSVKYTVQLYILYFFEELLCFRNVILKW